MESVIFRAFGIIGVLATSSALAMPLSTYVSQVLQSNPRVAQPARVLAQVEGDQKIADAGWRPDLDLAASAGMYSIKKPSTGNVRQDYDSHQWQLTLRQNLFNGYDTTEQVKQNAARRAATEAFLLDQADNTALEAVRAYLEGQKQKSLLQLAQQNLAAHRAKYQQVLERNEGGLGLRSDVEQTAARLAQAEASVIAQENNLQDALATLSSLLGTPVAVGDLEDVATDTSHSPMDLASLTEMAFENHAALKVAEDNIEGARAEYRRAKSNDYPKIDLVLSTLHGNDIDNDGGNTSDQSAELTLNYNLYNGGEDTARKGKALQRLYELQEAARQTRLEIEQNLVLAWNADRYLAKQKGPLQRYVEMASKTAQSHEQEFDLGQRDLLDLLDSKTELNEAEKGLTTAEYDATIAAWRVQEATGRLLETLGISVTAIDGELQVESE